MICLVAGSLLLTDAAMSATPAGRIRVIVAAALAIAALIVVGLIYQPMLFFYVPLFVLRFWATPHSPGRASWRIVALHGTILAVAAGVCFCVYKLGALPGSRGSFPTDWAIKAGWFVARPLSNALNVININVFSAAAPWIACVAATTITAGTFLAFRRHRPRWAALARAAVLPATIILAYAPSLIVIENWETFRSSYALYCTTLVSLMWALYTLFSALGKWHPNAWRALAGVLAIAACVLAHIQCRTLFALPQQNEFALLKSQVAQLPLKPGDRVLLIPPQKHDGGTWIRLYDEYGMPSSSAAWVQQSIFWLALRETHPQLARNPQTVTLTVAQPATAAPPCDYVIDLHTALPRSRR